MARSYTAKNIAATTADFVLDAGVYLLDAHATWGGGSLTLKKKAADGVSYVPVTARAGTHPVVADSTASFDIGYGTYQLAIATATAVYAQLSRVSERS